MGDLPTAVLDFGDGAADAVTAVGIENDHDQNTAVVSDIGTDHHDDVVVVVVAAADVFVVVAAAVHTAGVHTGIAVWLHVAVSVVSRPGWTAYVVVDIRTGVESEKHDAGESKFDHHCRCCC